MNPAVRKSRAAPRAAPKRRAPGRPAGGTPSQREALIDAARECFARHGFAAASLRQVAQEARVTPALAHYYFTTKEGLLAAVVEERIAPLVAEVLAALSAEAQEPVAALRAFVREYSRVAAMNPWLPRLVLREVLSDGGALREQFQSRFASQIAGRLRALVVAGQKSGSIDGSLDPSRVMLSVASLCLFPFVAAPLVSGVLGVKITPDAVPALVDHHLAVLTRGIGRLEE